MTIFTRENIQRVTREIVAEYGDDYVNPGAASGNCSYMGDELLGIPSCLVGEIVKRLDLPTFERLTDKEAGVPGLYGFTDFDTAMNREDEFTPIIDTDQDFQLSGALMEAQSRQDDGENWGRAAEDILALKLA